MSEPSNDPFRGLPFFGDLARMLAGQGPLSWDAARQFALAIATQGQPEANIDPLERMRYTEIGRVAELHVQQVTGRPVTSGGGIIEVIPVTPSVWASRALEAYRPLFERLAGALGAGAASPGTAPGSDIAAPDPADDDPGSALLGGLMAMLSPMLLGMSAGSMVGHLARRSFGQYDLPIPRPPSSELHVVAATVTRFADDWSLPADDLRLWVCLQELAHHTVLGVPHVRAELQRLIGDYVAGFRPNPNALEDRLREVELSDPAGAGLSELQQLFGDPEVLLGAMRSPEQEAIVPRLDALVAVVVGYVDHVLDLTAGRAIGSAGRIAEAVRRHRVEADQSDVFVARLLGLSLSQAAVDRGAAFIDGIVERAGEEALGRLWEAEKFLPTPAEVDAPGLWLARIELGD